MGDVKLALLMGAALGRGVLAAIMLAFVLAAIPAIGILIRHGRAGAKMGLPFGPFLALGSLVVPFVGLRCKAVSPVGGSLRRGSKADPPEVSQLNGPIDRAQRGVISPVEAIMLVRHGGDRRRDRDPVVHRDAAALAATPTPAHLVTQGADAAEAYRSDHGSYAGMNPAALRRYDASLDASSYRLVGLGPSGYCIQANSGGRTWHLGNPAGQRHPRQLSVAPGTGTRRLLHSCPRGGVAQLVRAAES